MQNKYSVIKQFLVNNLSSYKTVLGIVNVRLGAVHKLRDRFFAPLSILGTKIAAGCSAQQMKRH